ncbi:MAG: hypothetical protein KDB23_05560 [Planctomycetales bacterium]|nr:hypothetical protein [Planctomycetales bacterium]
MNEQPNESKLIKTCRSDNVTLGIFLRFGEHGPYLEPAKPVYRYRNEQGELAYSGYLRDKHCIHAAVCFRQAHDFIQDWKSNNVPASNHASLDSEAVAGGEASNEQ